MTTSSTPDLTATEFPSGAAQTESELRQNAEIGGADDEYAYGQWLVENGRSPEAEQWLQRAAKQGHGQAAFELSEMQSGAMERVHWLRESWTNGCASAALPLARELMATGERSLRFKASTIFANAIELNVDGALEACRSYADEGDEFAQFVCSMALTGEQAMDYLRKSAENGLPFAQKRLGSILNAQGKREGISWLKKAYKQGDPDAAIELGLHYVQKKNVKEAKAYIEFGARNGGLNAAQAIEIFNEAVDKHNASSNTWWLIVMVIWAVYQIIRHFYL